MHEIRECIASANADDHKAYLDKLNLNHRKVMRQTRIKYERLREDIFTQDCDDNSIISESNTSNNNHSYNEDVMNEVNIDKNSDGAGESKDNSINNIDAYISMEVDEMGAANTNGDNTEAATNELVEMEGDANISMEVDEMGGVSSTANTNGDNTEAVTNAVDINIDTSANKEVFVYVILTGIEHYYKVGRCSTTVADFKSRYHTYIGEFNYLKYSIPFDDKVTNSFRKAQSQAAKIESWFKDTHEGDSAFSGSTEHYFKEMDCVNMLNSYKKTLSKIIKCVLKQEVNRTP